MSRAKKKHPRDMTTEEAIKHLFHPKIVEHIKTEIAKINAPKTKKEKATK
jgi:hypothetical protein